MSTVTRCCCHQDGGLGGEVKGLGGTTVAATQRMTFFMRVLELMRVAGRLHGSVCSRPCRRPPAQKTADLGGCRFMGRCSWAGWRGVAYTNVDTARRMRGCFSASDERFVRLVREGGSSYFCHVTKEKLKHPPVTFPGALGRPPHRSAAHQRTSIHEHPAHKPRLFMGLTRGSSNRGKRRSGIFW